MIRTKSVPALAPGQRTYRISHDQHRVVCPASGLKWRVSEQQIATYRLHEHRKRIFREFRRGDLDDVLGNALRQGQRAFPL